MPRPAGQLKVRTDPLRTIQRWEWDCSGGEVSLKGLIVFVGDPPSEEFWLAVELFDRRRTPLAAAIQINSYDLAGWGVASIQATLETAVDPPYRLRVRYLEKSLPALTEWTLGPKPSEIRPWNQKELRSSS